MENKEMQQQQAAAPATPAAAAQTGAPQGAPGRGGRGPQRGGQRGGGQRGGGRGGRRDGRQSEPQEYEQKIMELARVTRVTAGGKRMRFRCCLVIGDKKGKVGYAIAKGIDVQAAIQKAFTRAKKQVMMIPLVNETIPHEARAKFGSAELLIKPAGHGVGVKAGGPLRTVLELGGVPNVVGKMLGSGNKINNVRATFEAISTLQRHAEAARERFAANAKKA